MTDDNYYFENFKPETNCTIWRYMDTAKFLFLLDSSSLFFANVSLFEDKHEGCFPKANTIPHLRYGSRIQKFMPIDFLKSADETFENVKENIFINCWHMNEFESEAMWKLYLNNDFGVAIQTTYEKLNETFKDGSDIINIGKVKYIDYEKHVIEEQNLHHVFLHKRKSFEHERELRAIILTGYEKNNSKGINSKINLNSLIQNIYISPNAPTWYKGTIENIVKKYNYDFNVVESGMDCVPINSLNKELKVNIEKEITKLIFTLYASNYKFDLDQKDNLVVKKQNSKKNKIFDNTIKYLELLINQWNSAYDSNVIRSEFKRIYSLPEDQFLAEFKQFCK